MSIVKDLRLVQWAKNLASFFSLQINWRRIGVAEIRKRLIWHTSESEIKSGKLK